MKLESPSLLTMISKQQLILIGLIFFGLYLLFVARNQTKALFSFFHQNGVPIASVTPFVEAVAPAGPTTSKNQPTCGINISGAEFGESSLPGKIETNYLYPAAKSDYSYFSSKNFKIVRIPFLWERIQPKALGPLSKTDLSGLKNMVAVAKQTNQKVILDLHNYGRYYGKPLTVSQSNLLADVWKKLATEFKSEQAVYGYELMNEPHDLSEGGDGWAKIAQNSVNQIRTVDSQHYVLIPGYGWQQAQSWTQNNPNLHITDASNKVIYAAHQYFDSDHTGTYSKAFDAKVNTAQNVKNDSQVFLDWLNKNNLQGIFTEYGVPGNDPQWLSLMDSFLQNAYQNQHVVGTVYWSAGPWWGNYILSLQPANGKDKPQMTILKRYCM